MFLTCIQLVLCYNFGTGFNQPLQTISRWYLKLGQACFPQHSFQFIIPYHSIIQAFKATTSELLADVKQTAEQIQQTKSCSKTVILQGSALTTMHSIWVYRSISLSDVVTP
jgi:hypothetical protein